MKVSLLLALCFLVTGCGSRQEITMPTNTVPVIKDSDVTQMGGFKLPKATGPTAPAK